MGRLISTGSVVVDLPLRVPHLPARGGDVLAEAAPATPGGGFVVVAAAARQGAEVGLASPVGTGPYGDLVRAALAAEGVRELTAPVPGETGLCLTLIEPDGERSFVTTVGVEGRPSPAALAAVRPVAGDVVYVSGYDLAYPDAAPVVSAWAAALPAGPRLVLDPGPLVAQIAPADLDRVLARVDLLTLNAREAALLTGEAAARAGQAAPDGTPGRSGVPDPAAAVRLLTGVRARLRPGCALVLRAGPGGCWVQEDADHRPVHLPGRAVSVVDSTGAGDTHTGVLLAGQLAGLELLAAAERANLAAALSVTRAGPATAPTAAELGVG